MKKTYIQPEIRLTVLDSEGIMAGSGEYGITFTGDKTSGTATLNDQEEQGGALGKQNNFWDEEY